MRRQPSSLTLHADRARSSLHWSGDPPAVLTSSVHFLQGSECEANVVKTYMFNTVSGNEYGKGYVKRTALYVHSKIKTQKWPARSR